MTVSLVMNPNTIVSKIFIVETSILFFTVSSFRFLSLFFCFEGGGGGGCLFYINFFPSIFDNAA